MKNVAKRTRAHKIFGFCSTSAMLALGLTLSATRAHAESIIRQPGNHPAYAVDLEPHAVLSIDDGPFASGGGFGLGARATIAFLKNGPISTINNDMGIGVGLDWVSLGNCYHGYWWQPYYNDCSIYSIYVPVVLQWNFYLTDIITVYGEPGLALRYSHISFNGGIAPNNIPYPPWSTSSTDLIPVFAGGAKFMFAKTVGLNVRLGYPYFSVGASILL